MRTKLEKMTDAAPTEKEKSVRRVKEAGIIRTPAQSRNIATARLRTAVAELTEANFENIQFLLDYVAFDDPKGALDIIIRMLEFSVPKLSRVEAHVSGVGSGTNIQDLTLGDLQQIINDSRTIPGEAKRVESDDETEDGEFRDLI